MARARQSRTSTERPGENARMADHAINFTRGLVNPVEGHVNLSLSQEPNNNVWSQSQPNPTPQALVSDPVTESRRHSPFHSATFSPPPQMGCRQSLTSSAIPPPGPHIRECLHRQQVPPSRQTPESPSRDHIILIHCIRTPARITSRQTVLAALSDDLQEHNTGAFET